MDLVYLCFMEVEACFVMFICKLKQGFWTLTTSFVPFLQHSSFSEIFVMKKIVEHCPKDAADQNKAALQITQYNSQWYYACVTAFMLWHNTTRAKQWHLYWLCSIGLMDLFFICVIRSIVSIHTFRGAMPLGSEQQLRHHLEMDFFQSMPEVKNLEIVWGQIKGSDKICVCEQGVPPAEISKFTKISSSALQVFVFKNPHLVKPKEVSGKGALRRVICFLLLLWVLQCILSWTDSILHEKEKVLPGDTWASKQVYYLTFISLKWWKYICQILNCCWFIFFLFYCCTFASTLGWPSLTCALSSPVLFFVWLILCESKSSSSALGALCLLLLSQTLSYSVSFVHLTFYPSCSLCLSLSACVCYCSLSQCYLFSVCTRYISELHSLSASSVLFLFVVFSHHSLPVYSGHSLSFVRPTWIFRDCKINVKRILRQRDNI